MDACANGTIREAQFGGSPAGSFGAATAAISSLLVVAEFEDERIKFRRLWKPMHLQLAFATNPSFVNGQPERLFNGSIMLPSGSAAQADEIQRFIKVLHTALEANRCP